MDLGAQGRMRLAALPIVLLFAQPARAEHTFGLGLRGTAQRVAPEHDEDRAMSLGGAGLQARWRFLPWLGVELAFEALHGEAAGGAFVRDSSMLTISAMWHVFPRSDWDFYVVFGVGGTGDKVTLVGAQTVKIEQKFEESHVSLGVGLEHLWPHWGVGVELRGVGLQRKDKDEALAQDAVPPKSSGAQGTVVVGYYF
jgi:hypothetical protein